MGYRPHPCTTYKVEYGKSNDCFKNQPDHLLNIIKEFEVETWCSDNDEWTIDHADLKAAVEMMRNDKVKYAQMFEHELTTCNIYIEDVILMLQDWLETAEIDDNGDIHIHWF